MEKQSKQSEQSPFFPFSTAVQLVVIVLLMGATFFAGVLWNKSGGSINLGGSAKTAPSAPTQAANTNADLDAQLASFAQGVGVNPKDFSSCLSSGQMKNLVATQEQTGVTSGVQGTPGIIILDTQTGKNAFVPGAYPYDSVKNLVDEMLAGKAPTLPDQNGADSPATTAPSLTPISQSDHITGNKNARIAMIEYSDFECPYCKQFYPTAKQLKSTYGDQMMWVYRQYPLPASLHPHAEEYSEASECVAKLGGNDAFWKYADKLVTLQ
jgi:protein-disulfide isomerase